MDIANQILVFTDGACSGNPGPGGYGTVVAYPEGQVKELGGGYASTTNNRMELKAVIEGLKEVTGRTESIWVLTDSTYVIRGITQWIWGWKRRGWTNSEGKPVSNQSEWKELDQVVSSLPNSIEWKYVRGHQGIPGNERCDAIAVAFTKRTSIDLYDGPLLGYDHAIHDVPDDMSLPKESSSSSKKKNKKAHSYLSYVNGELKRHATWPECEAVVKGRPGAKFKKSTSADDEVEIVKGWGLSPDRLND